MHQTDPTNRTNYNLTDYTLLDGDAQKSKGESNPPSTTNPLVDAGRKIGVLSLMTGKPHSVLQAMAERHAAYQAKVGKQGHQLWATERSKQLYRDLPICSSFAECVAESWEGQDQEAAAQDAYKCWRQSKGHWSAINGPCSFWGYAMAYNQGQKIWYACAVFGYLRDA